MRGRFAILCPGQGTQHAHMFELARTDPHVAAMIEAWWEHSRQPPLAALLHDHDRLYSNRLAQPLIVSATLAMWEAIRQRMPASAEPALVAGYSVGEVSAYAVAGALPVADAVRLATRRAELMEPKAEEPQAMIAVSRVTVERVGGLLESHGFYPAISTGADSFIAGGRPDSHAGGMHALTQALIHAGAGVTVLPVRVASHTPYMKEAAHAFGEELRRHGIGRPLIPVLAGISATLVQDPEQAISTLSRQLAEPIRWKECMDACAEARITVALELGPGNSLARMMHERHPGIECRSASDFRTLAGIEHWLSRRLGA